MAKSAARLVAFIALAAVCLVSPAEAKRVALVIGNASYQVGPLKNPERDAEAIAEVFKKKLGFDKVEFRRNLDNQGMRLVLSEFGREASGAEIAVVFFSGHGTEDTGSNYLIPVDAKLIRVADLDLEAIKLETVLNQIVGATKLKLVILDACRNDVFPLAGAKRTTARGLARIEPGDNTLVVYAAKEGTTADYGEGLAHSPFTAALLKHIATPGLDVTFVFRRVRDEVMAATSPPQKPHVYGTLGGQEVYFKTPETSPAAPVGAQTPAAPAQSEAAQAWGLIQNSEDVAVLEAFRRQYGASNSLYDQLASSRVESVKQAKAMVEEAAKAEADRQRIAMLQNEEAERKAALVPRPSHTFRDCPDCPEMVMLPAGEYLMRSPASEKHRSDVEGWQRKVTIAKPFAVGKYEVTRDQLEAFVKVSGFKAAGECDVWIGSEFKMQSGSFRRPGFDQTGGHPALCVSWDDAKAYVEWLANTAGQSYRLLTEAEWEYAARAGTTTPFSLGKPNAFGLHDLHGVVSEWVEDCYQSRYKEAPTDGSGFPTGKCESHVLRGGSRYFTPRDLRSAIRVWFTPGFRSFNIGFRVARTLGP